MARQHVSTNPTPGCPASIGNCSGWSDVSIDRIGELRAPGSLPADRGGMCSKVSVAVAPHARDQPVLRMSTALGTFTYLAHFRLQDGCGPTPWSRRDFTRNRTVPLGASVC